MIFKYSHLSLNLSLFHFLQVPLKRVHLFTLIQLTCLIVLWVIKSFSRTSILFPLMLVVMIGIRKSLDCVFTRRELKILDDVMPEMTRRAAADDMKDLESACGEVGLFQRFRICCLGTTSTASRAHLSRRSLSSTTGGSGRAQRKEKRMQKDFKVTFNVTPASPTTDTDPHIQDYPIENSPPHHSLPTNVTNHLAESQVPLL